MPSILCDNPDLVDAVLERLECGEVLTAICRDVGCTPSAFSHYANRDEAFGQRYARARELQASSIADDVVRIADEEKDVQRARVRSDARKWLASKVDPAKFGDRPMEVNVNVNLAQLIESSRAPTIEHEAEAASAISPPKP